jgi:uncharacterized protein YndB with AHSA1/START domain
MHLRDLSLFVLACLVATIADPTGAVQAEVKEATDGSYTVEQSYEVEAPAEKVWQTLIQPARWWSSSHTWSGKSENLTLDVKPGGGWDEVLPENGFVRHMTVIFCQPGQTLRLSGALGPMQEYAVQGVLTVKLAEDSGKTKLTIVYRVSGSFPGGLGKLAPVVDGVLKEQFTALAKVAAQ